MIKKCLAVLLFLVSFGVSQADAFCYDHTDKIIKKLERLELDTEQLKDIFEYQKSHRDLIVDSHRDGRGCGVHERAEIDFEKASIGVLDDEQFEEYTGRPRNEIESLRFENYRLEKELERLRAKLAELEAAMAAVK